MGSTSRLAGKDSSGHTRNDHPGDPGRYGSTSPSSTSVTKQALLRGEPDLFFTAPGYDHAPLVMVRLEKVDRARLEELITDAWQMRVDSA